MLRSSELSGGIVSIWLCGSSLLCLPAVAWDVPLVLAPQKIPAEADKWSLLPPESSLIDGDAVPLYEKAIEALPDKAADEQVRKLLDLPIDQLPLEEVEQVIGKHMDSLKGVAKAVRCRQCNWPDWKPGMEVSHLSDYRRIAFVIRLWARLEIADRRYEEAVTALQTGFGMGRHLGQGPTLVQALVAVSVTEMMSREVEEFVQRKGAPNLCSAFRTLPAPFIEIEKAIESERKAAFSKPTAEQFREQIESHMKPAHDRTRVIATRVETHLAALQCVEAIRSYAASHGGQLPAALADITEVSVPKDPTNGEPFAYVRTGSAATLESFLPPDGDERERIRYQIRLGN